MQQRPIKFRAWDSENSRYFVPTHRAYKGEIEELFLAPSGRLVLRDINHISDESVFPERFTLEQFTGLLDKNGKEIYEGDVILNKRFPKIPAVIEWDTYRAAFAAVNRQHQRDLGPGVRHDGNELPLDADELRNIEDIGNIHENPDLIESGAKQPAQ